MRGLGHLERTQRSMLGKAHEALCSDSQNDQPRTSTQCREFVVAESDERAGHLLLCGESNGHGSFIGLLFHYVSRKKIALLS